MTTKLFTMLLLAFSGMVWGQEEKKEFIQISPSYEDVNLDTVNVLRIESKLTANWKGVQSCGDQDRVYRNTDERALVWIKDKLFEHRDSKWVRYGWYYEKPNVRNWKDDWPSSARNCRGSVEFVIFIELEK